MIFELCELVCDRISQRLLQQAKSLKALQEKTPIF